MGLPPSLEEALKALNTDDVIGEALGEHIRQRFIKTKESELERFHLQVHPWEIEEYLKSY